jgi:hypothetical protein
VVNAAVGWLAGLLCSDANDSSKAKQLPTPGWLST